MEPVAGGTEGMEVKANTPKLLASTGAAFSCSILKFREWEVGSSRGQTGSEPRTDAIDEVETNYFKSIQWSVDGTSLFTNSADNILRTFIVPPDLLAPHDSPIALTPYSFLPSPEPIYTLTPYPFFSLQDQSTTLILSSPRDLPIRLSNALYPSIIATYPLVSPTTEAYLTPSTLLWNSEGTHFFTGTDSLITLFDVSQPGSGPVTRLPTIPSKRHKIKGGGVGMRGIVSCLSLQPVSTLSTATSLLAAGAWTRWVSLYDASGLGGTVANWSIAEAADSEARISGSGVSQVLWSPCGRYLFIVERKSRGILIYDIRVTGRLVGWLEGRSAETNQRLGVDVFPCMNGEGVAEIWAGGTDGMVSMWKWKSTVDDQKGNGMTPTEEWKAHESVVTGVALHSCGTVIATSSGQRMERGKFNDQESESESGSESIDNWAASITSSYSSREPRKSSDNSIKIWGL